MSECCKGLRDQGGQFDNTFTLKGCNRGKVEELVQGMLMVMKKRLGESMVDIGSTYGKNIDNAGSFGHLEERAATHVVSALDLNKNKVLQRGKKWRSIRMLLPENRCAKTFPKFCDVNGHDGISIKEWLGCVNV